MGATGSGGFVRLPCPDPLHRDQHSAFGGNLVIYTLQQILVDTVEILICASVAYPGFPIVVSEPGCLVIDSDHLHM